MNSKASSKEKNSTTSKNITDKPQAEALPKKEADSGVTKQSSKVEAGHKQKVIKDSARDEPKVEAKTLPDKKKVDEPDPFKVLLNAQTNKISPKSEGTIGFELVKDDKGILYLRLTSNTSSGNFCKNPVVLKTVIDILSKQLPDKPFNSKVMLSVFEGKGSKNSNNTSFLMAALRSKEIGLTMADVKKPLSSNLSPDFKAKAERLLAMS